MKIDSTLALSMLAITLFIGCARIGDSKPAVKRTEPSPEGKKFMLSAEPEAAKDVAEVRKSAADADDVVVVGRIGGSVDPWLEGVAAFSIVDPSLKACSDIPGDQCPTPWDYCCEANRKDLMALVKVVDDSGNVVKTDARTLLALQELDTVVVRGKAQRDGAGNLTILADGIHVRH